MSIPQYDTASPALPLQFKAALRQLASGVSVITTGKGPFRTGFTATSVASLSVDPPAITFAVNKNSSSYFVLRESGIVAVNFLAAHQGEIADRFAGKGGVKGEARFAGAEWTVLESGAATLIGALGVIDGVVEEMVERHSHAIVIARVLAARAAQGGDALLYWRGGYEAFSQTSPNTFINRSIAAVA